MSCYSDYLDMGTKAAALESAWFDAYGAAFAVDTNLGIQMQALAARNKIIINDIRFWMYSVCKAVEDVPKTKEDVFDLWLERASELSL